MKGKFPYKMGLKENETLSAIYAEGMAANLANWFTEEKNSFSYGELKAIAIGLEFCHRYINGLINQQFPEKCIDYEKWEQILNIVPNNNLSPYIRRKRIAARSNLIKNNIASLQKIIKNTLPDGMFDKIINSGEIKYWNGNPSNVLNYDFVSSVFKYCIHLNKLDHYSYQDYNQFCFEILEIIKRVIPPWTTICFSVGKDFRIAEGLFGYSPLCTNDLEGDGHTDGFSLNSLPNLKLLFDGDVGIVLNNGNVSEWQDQSGANESARNAFQDTALNQPYFNSNDADFNGHGSISFYGIHQLNTGIISCLNNQPTTYYFVVKVPQNSASYRNLIDGAGSSQRNSFSYHAGNCFSQYAGSELVGSSVVISPNSKAVICSVFNGANSEIYANAVRPAIITGNAGTQTPTQISIGNYSTSYPWFGKIALIAAYSGLHSEAEKTLVFDYLINKYNLVDYNWNPLKESGLIAYYDADSNVVYNSNLKVENWIDNSANGDQYRNAIQGTEANKPVLIKNDLDFNGHNSISFPINTLLKTNTFSTAIPAVSTHYIVYKGGGGNGIMVDGIVQNNRQLTQIDSGGNLSIYGGNTLASTTQPGTSIHISCSVFNGTSSSIYNDDFRTPKNTGNAGTNTATGLTLGNNYTGTANAFLGKIACIAIYSGAHNETQRNNIMAFYKTKYGIA